MGEAVLAIFKRTPSIVGVLIICTISIPVHSAVYVYRASDGSLMLTDHVVKLPPLCNEVSGSTVVIHRRMIGLFNKRHALMVWTRR